MQTPAAECRRADADASEDDASEDDADHLASHADGMPIPSLSSCLATHQSHLSHPRDGQIRPANKQRNRSHRTIQKH